MSDFLIELSSLKEEISEWHRATFPSCSMDSQKEKLFEETEELFVEITKYNDSDTLYEEIADVYIVSVVLFSRYNLFIGKMMCEYIEKNLCINHAHLLAEVRAKMEINKNRKWTVDNKGVPRHIGD